MNTNIFDYKKIKFYVHHETTPQKNNNQVKKDL